MTAQHDTPARAVSWMFLMRKVIHAAQWQVPPRGFLYVETKFSPNDHMRLKLCCVHIWHYFDKVYTWTSRVDACLFSMLNSFKLNLQDMTIRSWTNMRSLFAFYSKSDFAHLRSRVPLREFSDVLWDGGVEYPNERSSCTSLQCYVL